MTRRNKPPTSLRLKKAAPALLLLGLLGYLGAANLFTGNSDSGAIVQQAEALVVEAEQLTADDILESGNTFSSLQHWDPIPNPISVEPENIAFSFDQDDDPTTPLTVGKAVAGSISVITEPPPETDEIGSAAPDSEPLTLIPTYGWVNAFSAESVLSGVPVPVGSIVTAYDPDGVLIGRTAVKIAGEYGAMPLYMDDPSTQIDEGAVPGDLITFKINGLTTVVLGPNEPVWTENGGVLVLNLASGELPESESYPRN